MKIIVTPIASNISQSQKEKCFLLTSMSLDFVSMDLDSWLYYTACMFIQITYKNYKKILLLTFKNLLQVKSFNKFFVKYLFNYNLSN